jgi:RHS repeat-associated protein
VDSCSKTGPTPTSTDQTAHPSPKSPTPAAPSPTSLHTDQLGSVRLTTDATGAPRRAYTYDPYGNTNAATGTGTDSTLRYTGQYRDPETGLYYLRARYYDPATGAFLTRDPIGLATRSPYNYAGGNSLNASDPTGMFTIPGTGICVDIKDPNCFSLKESHPELSQAVADGAAGVLDTISGGNADRGLKTLGIDDNVRWGAGSIQAGRALGYTVAMLNPGAFVTSTTAGGFINSFDTSYSCLTGNHDAGCILDSSLAWPSVLVPSGAGLALGGLGTPVTDTLQLLLGIMFTTLSNSIDTARQYGANC